MNRGNVWAAQRAQELLGKAHWALATDVTEKRLTYDVAYWLRVVIGETMRAGQKVCPSGALVGVLYSEFNGSGQLPAYINTLLAGLEMAVAFFQSEPEGYAGEASMMEIIEVAHQIVCALELVTGKARA